MHSAVAKLELKQGATFASCAELNQWDGVIEGTNVTFPPGCAYYGQVKFASEGVTLDCNSGSIEGSPDGQVIVQPVEPSVEGSRNNPHVRYARYKKLYGTQLKPLFAGIVVARMDAAPGSCIPAAPAVKDVVIRNCTVRGFYQGIRLEREFEQARDASGKCRRINERHYYTGYDPALAGKYSYAAEYALERSQLYDRATKNVRIVNSTVERNGHAGIYVTGYSQFFSIEGTTIRNNGSVGIYLSHETRYNTVSRSRIVHNGWGSLDALVGYNVPGRGAVARKEREGIAIDASAYNTLSHNQISDNYRAGIALYKNCGEGHAADNPAVIRKQHSDYNRIVHNTIAGHVNRSGGKGDRTGYGVWIAQRQGLPFDPKDGASKHCRDPHVTTPNGEQRNYDYANFNAIAYNTFEDNWCSVRVEDDFNQIVGNEFLGTTKYDVYIGNEFRQSIGFPVRGTALVKNRSRSRTDNVSKRTIVPFAGSQERGAFRGEMYYERGLGDGSELRCLDKADGAPFNECRQPEGQLPDGVFGD